MDRKISNYMAKIGSRGGKKSRRKLTKKEIKKMLKARKEKQGY